MTVSRSAVDTSGSGFKMLARRGAPCGSLLAGVLCVSRLVSALGLSLRTGQTLPEIPGAPRWLQQNATHRGVGWAGNPRAKTFLLHRRCCSRGRGLRFLLQKQKNPWFPRGFDSPTGGAFATAATRRLLFFPCFRGLCNTDATLLFHPAACPEGKSSSRTSSSFPARYFAAA